MRREMTAFVMLAATVLLAGCGSPEFAYNLPPAGLDVSGPSIVVMPLTDNRVNHEADKVFKKGYGNYVEGSIGRELESMRMFSAVTVATNQANPPGADYQLMPTLQRLDWEIAHHGRVETEKAVAHTVNFISNMAIGLPVGNLFILGGVPVYGNSTLDMVVVRTADQKSLLNSEYSDTVTNRVKKSDCDKPEIKAAVMLLAFQNTAAEFKSDLLKRLLQDQNAAAAPKVVSPTKK